MPLKERRVQIDAAGEKAAIWERNESAVLPLQGLDARLVSVRDRWPDGLDGATERPALRCARAAFLGTPVCDGGDDVARSAGEAGQAAPLSFDVVCGARIELRDVADGILAGKVVHTKVAKEG